MTKGLVCVHKGAFGHAAREMIKQDLTIVPCSTSSFTEGAPDPIRLWEDHGTFLSIPRGYYNDKIKKRFEPLIHFPYSVGRSTLKPTNPIVLREGQEEIICQAMAAICKNEFGGAIIEAQTGVGKTILGLEIARRLGLKTLVVVHTNVLKEQWIAQFKKFFGWDAGVVQAGVCQTEGHEVCVGMLQTLSMGQLPEKVLDEFGLIIWDECHLLGPAEFQKALFRFRPRYMLGLSGTLTRKDRADNVFKFGIGETIKAMSSIQALSPVIYFVDTQYVHTDRESELDRERVAFLGQVIYNSARNQLIVKNAIKAAQSGRHVLILSERVVHVALLYDAIGKELTKESLIISVGHMTGTTKKHEREKAQTAQIIIATVQLLGVGFDNPRLDTLIFATPVQNLEQCVGRILRSHPEKKNPIVIDLIDTSEMAKIFGFSRRKKYLAKNWEIQGDGCLKKQIRRIL